MCGADNNKICRILFGNCTSAAALWIRESATDAWMWDKSFRTYCGTIGLVKYPLSHGSSTVDKFVK